MKAFCSRLILMLLLIFVTATLVLIVVADEGNRWPSGITPIRQEAALIKYRIIPDCLDTISDYDLQVEFEPNKPIYYGNFVQPTENLTHFLYHIEWDTAKMDHFTFMLLGLDEPTRANPTKREYIFMLVTNIHSYGVLGGHEVIEYKQPQISQNSGVHRYVLLVYMQPDRNLTMNWPYVNSSSEAHRANFDNRKFAKKHKLGKPYAMNFFISHYLEPGAPIPGPTSTTESTTNFWQKLHAEKQNQEQE